eukprot:239373_1
MTILKVAIPLMIWLECVLSSTFKDWINPSRINELETAYYNLLDHNNDQKVTIYEIALGIYSTLPAESLFSDNYHLSFIPNKYSCIPSLNLVDFIDCLSISFRLQMKNNKHTINRMMHNTMSFEESFQQYLGTCTDIPPPTNKYKYCHDIIAHNQELCMKWTIENQPYCQLSCYSCNKHSNIFSKTSTVSKRTEKLSQFTNEAVNVNCSAVPIDNHMGKILIVSDIHIEPWYNVDGPEWVSRFDGADLSNMFQCRNSSGKQVACTLTGDSDPPFPLFSTAMDFLNNHASNKDSNNKILIMGGDTQTHSYTKNVSANETETVPILLEKVVNYMLNSFDGNNIFYTPGNNDGTHNTIFCNGSNIAVDTAWANVLIKNKIINNDLGRIYKVGNMTYDQITLFNNSGYYIKKIPPIFDTLVDNENFYAIILNTNLGLNNPLQTEIFNDDLEWIKNQTNGHCLVIGHHPNVTPYIIPSQYQSIVRGSLSGHVHYFVPTNESNFNFTILPAVTQDDVTSGVLTGDLNQDGNLVLNWDNYNQYLGANHTVPQENCWGYNGPPNKTYNAE